MKHALQKAYTLYMTEYGVFSGPVNRSTGTAIKNAVEERDGMGRLPVARNP
jgi:hypothetical protein